MDISMRQDVRARESRLQETLQTMDVVDELRHRQAELEQLSQGDEAQLKAKLAQIYRSQGIEVSDAILEAGIKARRDQRFVHARPTGPAVALAALWIARGRLVRKVASTAGFMALLAAIGYVTLVVPIERRVTRNMAEINAAIAELPTRAQSLKRDLAGAQVRLHRAAESAQGDDRIDAAVDRMTAETDLSAVKISTVIDQIERIAIPQVTRANYDAEHEHTIQMVRASRGIAKQASHDIGAIDAAGKKVVLLHALSQLLEKTDEANALPAEENVQSARRGLVAAAQAALTQGQTDEAQAAIERLQGLADAARRLDELRSQAQTLLAAGRDTHPDRTADVRLDQAHTAVLDAIAAVNLAYGMPALIAVQQSTERLQEVTEDLAKDYTLTIVNRGGVRSGVWRYSKDNQSARNYYVVVEAIDAQGHAIPVTVRNEETGRLERVSLLAVRVPESQYERVKADKLDNGLVEDNMVGRKHRGSLDVSFEMPVSGGYITHW